MQCKQREELSKATLCREINDLLAHLFGNDNPAAYAAICGAQDHSSVYCSHFVEESVYNETRGRPFYMKMVGEYAARDVLQPAFRELLYDLYDDFNYGDISAVFLWPKLCMTIVGKWNPVVEATRIPKFEYCLVAKNWLSLQKWTGRCERRAHYCGQKDPKLLTEISFGFFFHMCKPHPTAIERAYCLKEMLPSYISLFLDGGMDMFYTVGSAALNFVEEYVDGLPAEIFRPLFDSCRIDQLMQFDNRTHECMGHSHIVASDRKYCSKIIAVCSRRDSKACRSVGRASAVKRSTGQRFTIYIIGFGPLAFLLLGLFWCCPYAESWYLRRQYRKYEAELRLLNSKSRAVASESTTMSMATVMSASTSISVVKSRPRS
ncbi:unnamed protein product, partial [Mesorhabditis spiculigera]